MSASFQHNWERRDSYHENASQRRAGKACQNCRGRKVKCNVTQHGAPCRNCRVNNVRCLIARCRRGKKQKEWYTRAIKIDRVQPLPCHVPVEELFEPRHNKANANSKPHHTYQEDTHHDASPPLTLSSNAAALMDSMVSLGDVPQGLELLQPSITTFTPPPEDACFEEMPACFQPFPEHLAARDIEYIRSKGALCVPHRRLRNEVIRCYVEYMHPYMPLLDVNELLQIADPSIDASMTPKYSLLLFQCVMFAAVAFVDEALVKEVGYDSLKLARKAFYQKTRILYDVDIECDTLTLIQSLLLMSLWCEKPDSQKQGWHWMGIAISLAQILGLNRNQDVLGLSEKERSLHKRVWWCCFMRDRLLSLGMSRPMRIHDGDFDVPLLTLKDFETDIHITSLDVRGCSYDFPVHTSLCDKNTRTQLAEIFISNLKLCMVLGSIFSTQYSTLERPLRSQKREGGSYSSVLLFPISNRSLDHNLDQHANSTLSLLDTELTEWCDSLPRSTRLSQLQPQLQAPFRRATPRNNIYTKHCVSPKASSSQPVSVVVQCALLNISYHAVTSALHRPRNRSPPSEAKVSKSATDMASICAFLNARGLARYLPVNAITMLVPSIISNALHIKSMMLMAHRNQRSMAGKLETERARDNLSDLLVSLCVLREAYVGADWVSTFVDAFFNRERLRLVLAQSDAWEMTNKSGDRRRFEVELELDPADLNTPVDRGMVAEEYTPSMAQSLGVETDKALSAYLREFDAHATSSAGTDRFEEWFDSGGGDVSSGVDADESAWNSMINLTPFDSNGLVENWSMGSIAAAELDGNAEETLWNSFGVD